MTASALDTVLAALAAARLTTLITSDTITAPLRDKISPPTAPPPHPHTNHRIPLPNPAYIPTCPRCASIYAAATATALLAARARPIPRAILTTLALSQAAIYLNNHQPQPPSW